MEHLRIESNDGVATVTLARPQVHNAFNARLIDELRRAFEELGGAESVRAIVLAGEGKSFCGGADIHWMRASLDLSVEENRADARAMATMYRAIDRAPKPVVGRVHGAALGGGSGLVAVCDVAVAADDAVFGFTETKLGILPAVISPFVLAKIGQTHLRALALTGERFGAERALRVGLVHDVVATAGLDAAVARIVAEVRTASPTGIAAAKRLFAQIGRSSDDDVLDLTANAIAGQRTSAEGQEGLRAFLERRRAAFAT